MKNKEQFDDKLDQIKELVRIIGESLEKYHRDAMARSRLQIRNKAK